MSQEWTFDSLEPRRLLAGVTLLAHGNNGSIDDWVAAEAAAIVGRAGGASAASVYTLTVQDTGGGELGVTAFDADPGYGDYRNTTSSELVVRLDWTAIDDGSFSTGAVASAVANYFLLPRTSQRLPALAELPIHLIGHSRGASLVAEMARLFGRRGVIVDQTTFLDPHPVDGVDDILGADFGDAAMAVWDNVAFADNYWRTDNDTQNFDFDGEPVAGTLQGDLNDSVQQDFDISAHAAVPVYYIATTDLDLPTGAGGIKSSWYGSTSQKPARDATGYVFSRLGGGTRAAGGLGPLLAGSAARSSAGQSGAQFPNVFDLKAKGGSSFVAGTNFNVAFRGSDRDGQAAYEIYMDADRNPYNGAGTLIASNVLAGNVDDFESSSTAGQLPVGKYVLAAKIIDDDGQTRWFYGRTIRMTEPPPVGTLSNGVLRVDGSSAADAISVSESGGQLVASLGSLSSNYNSADVNRIEILAGDGNDNVSVNGGIPAYVDAAGGNDTVFGGDANDTLTGGAGKNLLVGGFGDDRLNGSGSRDSIQGGQGDDRLYGNGGDDTLDGGGNVDRLFGGDGNDSLFGASSNDKLYGEVGDDTLFGGNGDDILDGGAGTDSAEDRSGDDRVSIEVLL